MTAAAIIGFVAVCVLACAAGWAALRWGGKEAARQVKGE